MSIATVRSTIAARVATCATSPYAALTESQEPYAFVRDPAHSPVHMEFVVDIPETRDAGTQATQAVADGLYVDHRVVVGFWWHLADKDKVSDWTTMLGLETSIRNTLMAIGWTSDGAGTYFSSLVFSTATRQPGIYGWVWCEQTFRALQQLPVT